MKTEPEYYMNKEQIVELMGNGSIDEWIDCLNFAPQGVLDLIKDLSVSLPLNDVNKREILKDKIGFDVDAAIRNNLADKTDSATTTQPSSGPARRASAPNYKIVEKK